MSFTIHADAAPLRVDAHGDVRVGASRVLLDMVVHSFNDGATPETIVQDFSTLTLADTYGAIAYYLRHRQEVDEYLRQREAVGQRLLREIEATQPDRTGLRERLMARLKAAEGRNAAPAQ
ncbi:MAG TPA: DUF433 domain-containing protein [Gemmataceae bacterium]|nr:DUF433 domain-containing protein [Gemmataceae bacterium]